MTRFSITAATLLAAGLLLGAADADAHGGRHGVHDGYRGPAHVVHSWRDVHTVTIGPSRPQLPASAGRRTGGNQH